MAPNEPRVPKQKRSAEKKQLLSAAAVKLFAEKGYFNTSSNEIAKTAGVSIGTFYSYFPDKKAVYEEAVQELYHMVFQKIENLTVPEDMPPRQILDMYIRLLIKEHEYQKDFQKEIHALSSMNDDFHAMEEKNRKFVQERILALLSRFSFRQRTTDQNVTAFIISNTIETFVHNIVFFGCPYDTNQVIEELTDMLCRYVLSDDEQNSNI